MSDALDWFARLAPTLGAELATECADALADQGFDVVEYDARRAQSANDSVIYFERLPTGIVCRWA